MMTIVSPSATSSEKPLSTFLGPNALWTSTRRIMRGIWPSRTGRARRARSVQARRCDEGRLREPALEVVRVGRARPRSSAARPRTSGAISCREAAERASDVALPEALQRAVAKLAHALARDAEHRADLLERVLAPTL